MRNESCCSLHWHQLQLGEGLLVARPILRSLKNDIHYERHDEIFESLGNAERGLVDQNKDENICKQSELSSQNILARKFN